MTRIDDSEDRWLREAQEVDQRQKADREKRSTDERVSKSFDQVIRERSVRENAQKNEKKATEKGSPDTKRAKDPKSSDKRPKGGQSSSELARRAALNQALGKSLAKVRNEL